MPLNQWLLFYIPSTPLAILLIGLFLGITIGSLFLVRRFIPFHRLKSHNDVAGFIFSTIGVIYAVLLAFMVIVSQVWGQVLQLSIQFLTRDAQGGSGTSFRARHFNNGIC